MLRAPEPVVLAVADISGYTSYLAGTELDHAQDVLTDLLETVIGKLAPPFTLVAVEGDACFVFAPTPTMSGPQLLDTIDACYFAFRRRLRDVSQATSCQCNACILIPKLDLKFVVHSGQAVRQTVGGRENLAGSDVIALHRLLKNHVVEQRGFRAYALLTKECVEALGLDCPRLDMIAHTEEYDVGTVEGFVEDLGARWVAEELRAQHHLDDDSAWMRMDRDMAASPPVVWEWITSPRLRPRWQVGVIRVDQSNTDGRAGVGTTNHCIHGKDAVIEEVLEWRPFESVTLMSTTQMGPMISTFDLAPTPAGTQVTLYVAGLKSEDSDAIWAVAKGIVAELFGGSLTNLQTQLADAQVSPEPAAPATA